MDSFRIIEVNLRTQALIDQLYVVWETAAKMSHTFFSEKAFNLVGNYVPSALREIERLFIAKVDDSPVAFLGFKDDRIEMLFVMPEYQDKGIGKALVMNLANKYKLNEVIVYEQNPRARGFYEHIGFKEFKRSEYDEQGKHYPILYMSLQ